MKGGRRRGLMGVVRALDETQEGRRTMGASVQRSLGTMSAGIVRGACRRQVGRRGDGGAKVNEASSERGKVRICVARAASLLFILPPAHKLRAPLHSVPLGQIRRSTPPPGVQMLFAPVCLPVSRQASLAYIQYSHSQCTRITRFSILRACFVHERRSMTSTEATAAAVGS